MSRFNEPSPGTKVQNLAGGEAYAQSPELEFISILLTSFANDQFYKGANETFDTLKSLIPKLNKEFAAKAAVYARTKFGMRSISHVVASELARSLSGTAWAKEFYNQIIHRPDDMMEIMAYHTAKNGKVTNAMKAGFALAFDKFDKYQLAKYRGEQKTFKLIDVVNLVRPVPVEKNAEAIAALVKGELKSFDTWESELTKAGQVAETDEQKDELKAEAWTKLIREKKIGYFALLRNLRNIIEQAPDVLDEALELLVDEKLIKKSLVLPFRFSTAFEEIKKLSAGPAIRKVMDYINQAIDISVNNVPKFDGDTLVVLDCSGSMSGRPAEIGSLFAAVLVKSNNADFMMFSDNAGYVNVNPKDTTMTIVNNMRFASGGTNFHAIFQKANRKYDRVIILSDMQGWIGHNTPVTSYNQWRGQYGASPFVYSFDLAGHGTMQFPEQNVFCLAGFSDKVFNIMSLVESDKKALISEVEKISFVRKTE